MLLEVYSVHNLICIINFKSHHIDQTVILVNNAVLISAKQCSKVLHRKQKHDSVTKNSLRV